MGLSKYSWDWVPKVLLDDLIVTPGSGGFYLAWTGFLQGRKLPEIIAECKSQFLPTAIQGVKLWVPADSITYAFIP